jgi:putative MFS transporter
VAIRAARRSATFRPFHWALLAVGGLGQVASALELGLLSLALPALSQRLGLQIGQTGLVMAAQALGALTTALTAGSLADRLGRKVVLLLGLGLMGLGAAASALVAGEAQASSFWWLLPAQFVVGLGTGCMPISMNTLLAELAPAAVRGRLLSLLQPLWVVGVLLAALLGSFVHPWLGPRGVFLVGLMPLLFAVPVWRWLPESPRSLLARGREVEARKLVDWLERRHGVRPEPIRPAATTERGSAGRSSGRELLEPALRRRTCCMGALWGSLVASYSLFLYWLPAMLVSSGVSVQGAYQLVLAITVAQLPFIVLVSLVVDRLGRKWTVVPALLVSALCSLWLGWADGTLAVVASGTAFAITNLMGWAVMQGYTPEVFPTRLRARGMGWSSAVGRITALFTPLVIGALVARGGGKEAVFAFNAGLLLVGGMLVAWLGEETRGRTLEEIAA